MEGINSDASAAAVEDEIIFVQTCIESLDKHSDFYQTQKTELEEQLAKLEKRLDELLPHDATLDGANEMHDSSIPGHWPEQESDDEDSNSFPDVDESPFASGPSSDSTVSGLEAHASAMRKRPREPSLVDHRHKQPRFRQNRIGLMPYDSSESSSSTHRDTNAFFNSKSLDRQRIAEALFRKKRLNELQDAEYARSLAMANEETPVEGPLSYPEIGSIQTQLPFNQPPPGRLLGSRFTPSEGFPAFNDNEHANFTQDLPERLSPRAVRAPPPMNAPTESSGSSSLAPLRTAVVRSMPQDTDVVDLTDDADDDFVILGESRHGPSASGSTSFASGLRNTISGIGGMIGELVGSSGAAPSFPSGLFGGNFLPDYDSFTRTARQLALDRLEEDYGYLRADPTRSAEEINALLENIRPDEDLPEELRKGTPAAFRMPLLPHQQLGLTWLERMEEGANKGGILADDMGLGKTIQALALMVSRKSEEPRCKTTLIVAPVALLRQWQREIEDKLRSGSHALTVYSYWGTKKKGIKFRDLRQKDVVLTSYGTVAHELSARDKQEERKKSNPNYQVPAKEELVLLGDNSRWYRIILDEAQLIKNKNTLTAKACCRLQATYRLCMTGTPMQNSLEELYSLLRFLRIKPYCDWDRFRNDLLYNLKSNNERLQQRGMQAFQALLRGISLRRTKKSLIDGKPLISLPERTMETQDAPFDDEQQAFYKALETQTQLTFNRYLKKGTVGSNYSNILVLLLRLRQACCHPHLIKDFAQRVDNDPGVMEDLAKSLEKGVVKRIIEADGSFECPICFDACPNPAIFYPCGHDCCPECFQQLCDNAQQAGDTTGNARCPECRSPIKKQELVDYRMFKKVHMPREFTKDDAKELGLEHEKADGETSDKEEAEESGSDSNSESETDEDDDLADFVVNDDEDIEENEWSDGRDEDRGKQLVKKSSSSKLKGKQKVRRSSKKGRAVKGLESGSFKSLSLAELKRLSTRNKKARKQYFRKLQKDYQPSSKIECCVELLRSIHENDASEKTIIFSQWTSLLDLLEVALNRAEMPCTRYDGSMAAADRDNAVFDFSKNLSLNIMLISLKAGNAGLNLNAASQVIILDPFWNPYVEEQAIDRAHRIGQRRPVTIHRICVKGTVEDRILELQEKKRGMISQALDETASKAVSRLGMRELAYLFGVTRNVNDRLPAITAA